MSTEEKTISLALSFAQWAVAGDWQKISDLLSSKAAGKFPPEKLKKGYEKMLAYARRADGTYGDIKVGELVDVQKMNEWGSQNQGDEFWAYVTITGDDFSEAVTLVFDKNQKITSVEWGRP